MQSLNPLHERKTGSLGIKILDALEKEIKIFHRLCLRTMGHRVELFLDILRTSVGKWSSQPKTIAAAFYKTTMVEFTNFVQKLY